MFSAIEPSKVTRRCSSTNETHLRIPHHSTVRIANDASSAKRLSSSTCEILLYMLLRPSSVRPAIDFSAMQGLWSSTSVTPRFTSKIQKPPWTSSSTLSQRSDMTLPSHQLHPMPTCRNTKDGSVASPRRRKLGIGIRMPWRANCASGMVQRTIWLRGMPCVVPSVSSRFLELVSNAKKYESIA